MNLNPERLKKSSLFHILIIATLAIGLYLNTLKNGLVYDDVSLTIVNNTFINSLDNLPLLFDKTAYFTHSGEMSYRPVVTFTYFIDYAIYGLNPLGYHLTNVLLHAINGALVYFLLTLLLTPHSSRFTSPPFLISLLFINHPVLTEAVNCISYREDLLAFLFYMTTLTLYLILRQPASDHRPPATALLYLLSCLTYLLALLSKEMAVTLPLIIICYEWLYNIEKTRLPSRLFNRYIIGYIAITVFYLYLRFNLFHNPEEQIGIWSLVERFLSLPWLIMNYLKLSFFPVQLSADYVINPVSFPFSPIFILSLITLVFIFTIILLYFPFNKGEQKRFPPLVKGDVRVFENGFSGQRSILFGALYFLITLAPVYNLVPLFNPFAERYLYLPMAGFVMSAVSIAYLIADKLKIRSEYKNRYVPVLFLVVLVIFSFSVVNRNAIWRDDYSLWSDTVVKMPNSGRAHYNLGNAYSAQGRLDEAIQAYLTALRLKPDHVDAYYNLGNAYSAQGRLNEAIQAYLTALRLKPDHVSAYNNLGNAYYKQGRYDEGNREYLTAIKLKYNNASAYIELGVSYGQQGLLDEAIKEFLGAIRLKPDDAEAHYNLGIVYFKQGRYDEAVSAFSMALKLKPDYKEAYQNVEALMKRKKNYKNAGNATASKDKNWSP